jgi:hypothetical protein
MQEKQNYSQLRQYYRIRYPLSYRPKVRTQVMGLEGDIVELSERGVRFICKGESILSEGSHLEVTITFHDGDSFELKGEILKVTNKDVIVRFIDWLPLIRIIKEQIYLRNHFVGHM